jgi:hypothetical protein
MVNEIYWGLGTGVWEHPYQLHRPAVYLCIERDHIPVYETRCIFPQLNKINNNIIKLNKIIKSS